MRPLVSNLAAATWMGGPPTSRSWSAMKATRGTALGGVDGLSRWNRWRRADRQGSDFVAPNASLDPSGGDQFVEFPVAGQVQKRGNAALHRTPRCWRADESSRDAEPVQA